METDPKHPSTDKVNSFYVEKWPEPTVKLGIKLITYTYVKLRHILIVKTFIQVPLI